MDLLKLVALDSEDLKVVSAHLQDAIVRVGDLTYLPLEARFALLVRRFDWESDPKEAPRRRLTALHFERVTAVRTHGIDRARSDAILSLLALTFEANDPPSGTVTFLCSEGGALQIDVDYIEMQMADLGPIWEVEGRPDHESDVSTGSEFA